MPHLSAFFNSVQLRKSFSVNLYNNDAIIRLKVQVDHRFGHQLWNVLGSTEAGGPLVWWVILQTLCQILLKTQFKPFNTYLSWSVASKVRFISCPQLSRALLSKAELVVVKQPGHAPQDFIGCGKTRDYLHFSFDMKLICIDLQGVVIRRSKASRYFGKHSPYNAW